MSERPPGADFRPLVTLADFPISKFRATNHSLGKHPFPNSNTIGDRAVAERMAYAEASQIDRAIPQRLKALEAINERALIQARLFGSQSQHSVNMADIEKIANLSQDIDIYFRACAQLIEKAEIAAASIQKAT